MPLSGFLINAIGQKVQTILFYWGIHEKGSGDGVSAVCYTIYTINISLCTQTAETTISPEPFVNSPVA